MDAKRQPWDQLPDEPDSEYANFLLYRNLGAGRSQQLAYQQHLDTFRNRNPDVTYDRTKKPSVPGHWKDAAAKHRWYDRAVAWDIAQLENQGPELARLWASILISAARKAAECLANPRCRPRTFGEALAVLDRLSPYLTPDAIRPLAQPAADGVPKPRVERVAVE